MAARARTRASRLHRLRRPARLSAPSRSRAYGLRPIKKRQRDNEHLPDDTVAEAAQKLEGPAHQRPGSAAVQTAADTVVRRIDASEKAAKRNRFHIGRKSAALKTARVVSRLTTMAEV